MGVGIDDDVRLEDVGKFICRWKKWHADNAGNDKSIKMVPEVGQVENGILVELRKDRRKSWDRLPTNPVDACGKTGYIKKSHVEILNYMSVYI